MEACSQPFPAQKDKPSEGEAGQLPYALGRGFAPAFLFPTRIRAGRIERHRQR
jgi:hypothetical protein